MIRWELRDQSRGEAERYLLGSDQASRSEAEIDQKRYQKRPGKIWLLESQKRGGGDQRKKRERAGGQEAQEILRFFGEAVTDLAAV